MIISIFANTALAASAPQTIVISVNEIKQDVRFNLLSNNFGAIFGSWINNLLLFVSANRKQTSSVSRIEILPGGDVTVRQGEPVNFTATAYSADGTAVSGIKFDWTVQDVGRNRNPKNMPNGVFSARAAGRFLVTAKAEGIQARVNVTVEENKGLNILKNIKDDESNGRNSDKIKELKNQKKYRTEEIDSKKDYKNGNGNNSLQDGSSQAEVESDVRSHGPNAESSVSESGEATENSASMLMMRPYDEDGWNNNNWWMADDPGNQTGNPTGTAPASEAGNGNFQFSSPVIALPGRGIDLNLSLNYNSRVWSKSGNQMIFDSERGFPAPGWSLGFGKMMFMGTSGGCMLIDADGTQRGYTGNLSNYSSGNYSSTNFNGHTADGTFIDYNCWVSTYNGVTSMSGSARLPNGTQISYYANSANGTQAFPTQISDSQGNYITVSYLNNRGPQIQTVTDTLGRVINFNYDSSTPARLISVTAPKMDNAGTRTLLQLHYKQLTLNPGWASGVSTNTNNWSPYVIDAIYYPGTNTGYWFNDSDSYSSYGMIAKVIEQRGMSWSGSAGDQGTVTAGTMSKQAIYNYTLTPDYTLTDAPTYSTLTESWAGMDTAAAITSYSINNNDYHSDGTSNSPCRTVTVTQPNGLVSKQYSYRTPGAWTDGLIFTDETIVVNGSTQTVVGSSLTSWQQGNYDSPRPSWTKTTDEKGQQLLTTYTYGADYNQLTSQKQYDYDGTTLLRETRNSYQNSASYTGRHVFNLTLSSEVYDGAGNRAAKTDYEYDDNAVVTGTVNLKATPDVVMHFAQYDPYTTETQDGPNCLQWSYSDPYDPYNSQYCIEYEQVSAYNTGTMFRGNLTKTTAYADAQTPSNAVTETKQYDVTGNLWAESASCCELRTYDYTIGTQYAYPTALTRGASDPNSTVRNTSSVIYDFNTGLLKQATDPNGRTDSTAYDPNTLRETGSNSSTGAYSVTSYDESAMTITEEVYEYGGTLAGKTIKYLNGIGKIVKEQGLGANSVWDIVETKYNNVGEIWKQSRPYRAGDTVQWTETIYDLLGRTTQVVEPDGSVSKAFYNETQKPDSATNSPGNTIRVTDSWGRERWGRYDAQQKLVEIIEPNPTGNGSVLAAGSLPTKYTYNTLGNLTQSEQGGQYRYFKYDSLSRLTRQKLAEQTATLNDAGTYVGAGQSGAFWSDAFVYDERSNMTLRTDARGVITHYVYGDINTGASDPLNRLKFKYYEVPSAHDTSSNIGAAFNVSYEYMTTGDQDRIKKIESTGLSKEEYIYDTEGRVKDYTQTIWYRENYPLAVSYQYDTLNRVKEVRYPAQYGLTGSPRKVVEQTYDVASRVSTLKYDGNRQAGDIVFNAAGQTTSVNIGTTGTNQVNEQYTFDPQTGLLTNQKVVRNNTALLDLTYDYNRNNSTGNLNGKTGHLTKVLDNLNHNKDREYQFDALGRLTNAKGGINGGLWSQTYTYDRWGNRTNVTASGVAADNSPIPPDGTPGLTYDTTNNRINTTLGYQYDAAGNQIRAKDAAGNWIKMEYDYANRLQVIKDDNGNVKQAFQFAPSGSRLMDADYSTSQTTFYANLGGTTLAEYVEFTYLQPTWVKSYTYFGESLLATVSNASGTESIEFNHPDQLGTRMMTNQQAGTSSEQKTLPFGTALNAESSAQTNKKRFTSYDRSSITGLDYAVNRTYDSKQGRFTQVDPIGMSASSSSHPQTLNLYAYCGNDPINHTDPSGLFWGFLKKLFKWVMIAVAVVVAIMTIAAGPTTLVGILGAISAGANAASQVLYGLGYRKAGLIFGLIAMATGLGSIIASKIGVGHFAGSDIKDDFTGAWFGLLGSIGAIANYSRRDKRKPKTGSPLEIRTTFFKLYGKKFNKCLKKAFGKDYKKIGKQTLGNSPVIDATLAGTQVGAISGVAAAVGNSDPFYGKNGKVFIANETYNSRGANVRKAVFGTYAHETANILDIRTNPKEPAATYGRVYGDTNDPDDTDTGAKVEKCLFGSLQYP